MQMRWLIKSDHMPSSKFLSDKRIKIAEELYVNIYSTLRYSRTITKYMYVSNVCKLYYCALQGLR